MEAKCEQLNADLTCAHRLTEVVQKELNSVIKGLHDERAAHAASKSELFDIKSNQTQAQNEIVSCKHLIASYEEERNALRDDMAQSAASLRAEKDQALREVGLLKIQLQEAREEVAALDGKLAEAFETKVQLESDLTNMTTDLSILQDKLRSELVASNAANAQHQLDMDELQSMTAAPEQQFEVAFTLDGSRQSNVGGDQRCDSYQR